MTDRIHQRRIRSFVKRAGRMTPAQKKAMQELWPQWGIDFSAQFIDVEQTFGRSTNLIVEIGFGNGELLTRLAADNPHQDYIGIEVHEPGVGHCLLQIQKRELSNVRIICHDAIEVLENQIPDGSLHGVHLFFPDPWHKKRHHKRRIVQPAFIELLAGKIGSGGYFYPATDWAPYAEHIREVMTHSSQFTERQTNLTQRPETKFELRGRKLGHDIWECIYDRQ